MAMALHRSIGIFIIVSFEWVFLSPSRPGQQPQLVQTIQQNPQIVQIQQQQNQQTQPVQMQQVTVQQQQPQAQAQQRKGLTLSVNLFAKISILPPKFHFTHQNEFNDEKIPSKPIFFLTE